MNQNQNLLITNNSKAYESHKESMEVLFLNEATYLEVLEQTRNLIHQGSKLLSHPMAGSLKPNQTPYRSILLEKPAYCGDHSQKLAPVIDMESLRLIENSIESANKFLAYKGTPAWPPKIKEDFKTVDLSIIDSAIK